MGDWNVCDGVWRKEFKIKSKEIVLEESYKIS